MGGSSYNHQLPTPIIQVTRETLSSRAGAPVLKPIFANQVLETNFFQLATKILSHLDDHFVCDQGGGTPLDSDLDQ